MITCIRYLRVKNVRVFLLYSWFIWFKIIWWGYFSFGCFRLVILSLYWILCLYVIFWWCKIFFIGTLVFVIHSLVDLNLMQNYLVEKNYLVHHYYLTNFIWLLLIFVENIFIFWELISIIAIDSSIKYLEVFSLFEEWLVSRMTYLSVLCFKKTDSLWACIFRLLLVESLINRLWLSCFNSVCYWFTNIFIWEN